MQSSQGVFPRGFSSRPPAGAKRGSFSRDPCLRCLEVKPTTRGAVLEAVVPGSLSALVRTQLPAARQVTGGVFPPVLARRLLQESGSGLPVSCSVSLDFGAVVCQLLPLPGGCETSPREGGRLTHAAVRAVTGAPTCSVTCSTARTASCVRLPWRGPVRASAERPPGRGVWVDLAPCSHRRPCVA